jgi:hypothetical protein
MAKQKYTCRTCGNIAKDSLFNRQCAFCEIGICNRCSPKGICRDCYKKFPEGSEHIFKLNRSTSWFFKLFSVLFFIGMIYLISSDLSPFIFRILMILPVFLIFIWLCNRNLNKAEKLAQLLKQQESPS